MSEPRDPFRLVAGEGPMGLSSRGSARPGSRGVVGGRELLSLRSACYGVPSVDDLAHGSLAPQ